MQYTQAPVRGPPGDQCVYAAACTWWCDAQVTTHKTCSNNDSRQAHTHTHGAATAAAVHVHSSVHSRLAICQTARMTQHTTLWPAAGTLALPQIRADEHGNDDCGTRRPVCDGAHTQGPTGLHCVMHPVEVHQHTRKAEAIPTPLYQHLHDTIPSELYTPSTSADSQVCLTQPPGRHAQPLPVPANLCLQIRSRVCTICPASQRIPTHSARAKLLTCTDRSNLSARQHTVTPPKDGCTSQLHTHVHKDTHPQPFIALPAQIACPGRHTRHRPCSVLLRFLRHTSLPQSVSC